MEIIKTFNWGNFTGLFSAFFIIPIIVFVVIFVIIIVLIVKNTKKRGNLEDTIATHVKNNLKKDSTSTDNIKCPYCNSSNPSTSRKCSSCGANLNK